MAKASANGKRLRPEESSEFEHDERDKDEDDEENQIRKKLRTTPARLARGNVTYESNAAKARRRQEPTPTKKKTAAKAKKAATLTERTNAIQFLEKQPSQNPSKGLKPQNPPKKPTTTARHSSGSSTSTTARPASKLVGSQPTSKRLSSSANQQSASQSLSQAPSRPPTQAPAPRPQLISANNQGTVSRTQPMACPSRPPQLGAATAPPHLGNYPNHSVPQPRSHPTAPVDFANADRQPASYTEPDGDQPEHQDLDLSRPRLWEDLDGRTLGQLSTVQYDNGQEDEFGTAADGLDRQWVDPGHTDWEWDDPRHEEGANDEDEEREIIGDDGGQEDEDEDRDEDEDGDGDEDDDEGEEEDKRQGEKGGKRGRAAAGHPEYAPYLMRTARRARSIIITRSPMPTPEQEYQAACDAWEYVTQDSRFEGEPFPEKLYTIVQQHNPTIRGRLKTVAVNLLGDYFKFSDPNLARNRQSNRRLYRSAVDDDAFLHEFPDEKKNRWFLTFTAIRCALDEWARGDEERVQFRIPEYEAVLESHLRNLKALKKHRARSIQAIQDWYWKKASGGNKKLRNRAVSKALTGQQLAATSAEIDARQSSEADYDDGVSMHSSDVDD